MFNTYAAARPADPRLGFGEAFSIETLTFLGLAIVLLVVSVVSGITGVGVFAGFCALAAMGYFAAGARTVTREVETTPAE